MQKKKDLILDRNGYLRRRGSKEPLHREICRAAHGPIPKGWNVHHVDWNKLNNSPENLIAIPYGMHRWVHETAERDASYRDFRFQDLKNRKVLEQKLKRRVSFREDLQRQVCEAGT